LERLISVAEGNRIREDACFWPVGTWKKPVEKLERSAEPNSKAANGWFQAGGRVTTLSPDLKPPKLHATPLHQMLPWSPQPAAHPGPQARSSTPYRFVP
jgi:hypothetical protein